MSTLNDPFQAFVGLLMRSLLLLAGALFVASLVTAGTLVAAVVLLWRLVSGRRPVVPRLTDLVSLFGGTWSLRPEMLRPRRAASGEVVEAEARVVSPVSRPLE